jgi:hypothetical protein
MKLGLVGAVVRAPGSTLKAIAMVLLGLLLGLDLYGNHQGGEHQSGLMVDAAEATQTERSECAYADTVSRATRDPRRGNCS